MGAQPAARMHWEPERPRPSDARTRTIERRRREQHLRRLRRDLLEDAGAALALTIALLIVCAGLGVVALLMVPLAGALVLSFGLERRARRRRRTRQRTSRRT